MRTTRELATTCRQICRVTLIVGITASLTACVGRGPRTALGIAPERVSGDSVSSIALLGSLHVSDSVRAIADSTVFLAVRNVCPSVRLLPAAETERALESRRVVVPRRLSASFAKEARDALQVDLLLAPMATGLVYDNRVTIAGFMEAVFGSGYSSLEDRAGMALEGWDLRSGEQVVWVVRTHATGNSWSGSPERLLRNATNDAVRRLAPMCQPPRSATLTP